MRGLGAEQAGSSEVCRVGPAPGWQRPSCSRRRQEQATAPRQSFQAGGPVPATPRLRGTVVSPVLWDGPCGPCRPAQPRAGPVSRARSVGEEGPPDCGQK